ncbi:hypothetical protein HHL25_09925 [Rhizobium sp. S-51]|uniref:Uncharacterized protein n=1 Tax=Rhizobium terricola TaxID=2728849 RepID=A0A7Y0AVW9_9HYPH|nr:hypothetical protein [Rhizobium terricola]NML74439.1 hypothetical protein [Rhizobium terricola]
MKQTDLILLCGLLPYEEGVSRIADTVQNSACAVHQHEAGNEKPEQNQYAGNSASRQGGKHRSKYPGAKDKVAAKVLRLPREHTSKVTPQGAFGARLDLRTLDFSLQPFAFDHAQISQQPILKAFPGHSMQAPFDTNVPKEVVSTFRNFNLYASSDATNLNHA